MGDIRSIQQIFGVLSNVTRRIVPRNVLSEMKTRKRTRTNNKVGKNFEKFSFPTSSLTFRKGGEGNVSRGRCHLKPIDCSEDIRDVGNITNGRGSGIGMT